MSGFDPHSPGYWYLVQDTDDGTVKHGISNKLKRRLADHIRQGFTVRLATRFFENGGDALELEGQIKAELKALRIPPARKNEDMPYGGHTETFSLDAVPSDSLLYRLLGVEKLTKIRRGMCL
jgi:predicted GIY-YIG superfamily endonuclease